MKALFICITLSSQVSMALNIKKLLVSQPKPASEKSPYFDIAEKYGVEIDFRPFIKVEPLSSKEFRQQRISVLDHTAVIFTARTAIDHSFIYARNCVWLSRKR